MDQSPNETRVERNNRLQREALRNINEAQDHLVDSSTSETPQVLALLAIAKLLYVLTNQDSIR